MLSLRIFEAKGYFAVHDDPLSRTLLDLAFWLWQTSRVGDTAIRQSEMVPIIGGWCRKDEQSFGLDGYSNDCLREWWSGRLAAGALEGDHERACFSRNASAELFQKLERMAKAKAQLTSPPKSDLILYGDKLSEPNERRRLQPALFEIGIRGNHKFIEVRDTLLKLSADTADEKIIERRQASQKNDRAVFDLAVGLRQRREGHVAFVHRRRSAAVYSGSVSP